MGEVFISYKRERYRYARRLARILEAHGYTTWWDHHLAAGDMYRDNISKALDRARVVLVLWCTQSISAGWVIDEAEEGKRGGKLAPVFIEKVRAPMGFRQIHGEDFIGWRGELDHPHLNALIAAVGRRIGRSPVRNEPTIAALRQRGPLPRLGEVETAFKSTGKPMAATPIRVAAPRTQPSPRSAAGDAREEEAWKAVGADAAALEKFLDIFPHGRFAERAIAKLDQYWLGKPHIMVDPNARGGHTTVSGAVAACQPGGVVLLRAGSVFEDHVRIDKPLTLRGLGASRPRIVGKERDAILVLDGDVRIENLILSNQLSDAALWLRGGSTLVRGCAISIAGGIVEKKNRSCVYADQKAHARLVGCDLGPTPASCVQALGDASVRVESCRISGADGTACHVSANARMDVLNNKFFSCQHFGVVYRANGRGDVRFNRFERFDQPAIVVDEQANVRVAENRIYDPSSCAVMFDGEAQGLFEANIVADAQGPAIFATGRSKPTILRNRLTGCASFAVLAAGESAPVIERHDFRDHERSVVMLRDASRAIVRDNSFDRCARTGVSSEGQSAPQIENNVFKNIGSVAICAHHDVVLSAKMNTISDCQGNGIQVNDRVTGSIFDNTMQNTGNDGVPAIWVETQERVVIKGNRMSGGSTLIYRHNLATKAVIEA